MSEKIDEPMADKRGPWTFEEKKPPWTPEMIDKLSGEQISVLMQSDSPINKARKVYSATRSTLENSRPSPIEMRRQEFKAVILILRALFSHL